MLSLLCLTKSDTEGKGFLSISICVTWKVKSSLHIKRQHHLFILYIGTRSKQHKVGLSRPGRVKESKGNDEVSEIPEATADLCNATDSTEPSDNSPPTGIQNPPPAKRRQVSLSLKGRCKSKENKENEQVIEKSEAIVDTVDSTDSPADAPPTSTTNWFQSMSDLELEQCKKKSVCVNTDWTFCVFNNWDF